jgi:hypothetical protein
MIFQTSAQIESVSTRADKTLKIVVGTQELNPEEKSALFGLMDKQGWFLFKENVIDIVDVPKEQAPEFDNDKSPSQRLRAVLYVYWDTKTAKKQSFNSFYDSFVEKKIKEIKETLD